MRRLDPSQFNCSSSLNWTGLQNIWMTSSGGKEGCGVRQQPPSILAWQQLVNIDTNKSAFKAFCFHSLCQIGGHVSHNSSECSKIPSWTASWYTMKLPPVPLLVCLLQTEFSNHSTVQLHHSHKHISNASPPVWWCILWKLKCSERIRLYGRL